MSIRLRLTLLYSLILAMTLAIFGFVLYIVQAQYTLNSLKRDLTEAGDGISRSILWMHTHPPEDQPGAVRPPETGKALAGDPAFLGLREQVIVRILDSNGDLVASPNVSDPSPLDLSEENRETVLALEAVWTTGTLNNERVLIYNRPLVEDGEVVLILQVARQLTERDRSLTSLSLTLLIASVILLVAAFGIGWIFATAALRPIDRITQVAQAIGNESDFSRRVDHTGPNDEIGRLATTFNSMLSRLQDAYQRVSEALLLQRNFVADVSHELRTPLTTVRGNLALLNHQPPLPAEEQADILADLEEESERLVRLVNNLLILARSDAGQNQANELVNLKQVVVETCQQTQNANPAREIGLDVAEVEVLGNRDALKQILVILLDNAIKYTRGPLVVKVTLEENEAIISVEDQGPGISAASLNHVFDRFYRAESTSGVQGFGLGLPIAKSLTEGLGGTIHIASLPEVGSTVQIRLPAMRESRPRK